MLTLDPAWCTNLSFQLVFSTVGWILLSLVWLILRGEEFRDDQEPDVEQLVRFILSEQEAFTNTAIGVGYVTINTVD